MSKDYEVRNGWIVAVVKAMRSEMDGFTAGGSCTSYSDSDNKICCLRRIHADAARGVCALQSSS